MSKRTGKQITMKGGMLLFLLFLLSSFVAGQELHTSVNKNPVSPGDRFEYTIELEGASGRIAPPDLSEFPKVMGPSKSQEVRMINGKVSRKIKVSYSIVAPEEEGKVRIGPARAKTDEGRLEGSSITLRIEKGASGSGQQEESVSTSGERNSSLLARIRLNKSSAYKGEAVRATFLLFSRYRNLDLTENPSFPSIDRAWTEEVDMETGWKGKPVKIDGKPYRKAVLRRLLIFPQSSGKLKIDPMKVTCRVNQGFFSKGKKVSVKSNSPTLNVEPLPSGAPASFNGAVGQYELRAGLDRDTVKTNGSVNLRLKINGSGNFQLIESPDVKIPADLEHYDPNVNERSEIGPSNVRGEKEWEYLIVPRQSGDYRIDPIAFSYFDPSEETYRTLNAGPFELRVREEKAKGTTRSEKRTPKAKEKVTVEEEKLRYLHTDLEELRKKDPSGRGFIHRALPFFPPILGALLFLILKKRRDRTDTERARARKTARARLKDAEKALKEGDRARFHEELYKGLRSHISERTGIPPSDLSKERIREKMKGMEIPDEMIQKTLRTLEHSEMLRYAPSSNVSDEEVHEETVSLLAELESYWK